jgi:4-diphosphocytidyl-2-C-methyl-D-erythritol kinase
MDTRLNKNGLTWWPSPAKLNLFLHINGRYENGYHQLQSLFQLLDLADELAFEVNNSGLITLAEPLIGVEHQDNLIVRAANKLKQLIACPTKQDLGCHIHIKKRLPMGGGIGGGSSNAATTLLVLNKLWDLDIEIPQLSQIGLQLGADVPIFIQGKTAFAEGVGEKLLGVSLPHSSYLLIFPDCHVSTAQVFAYADLPRETPKIDLNQYQFSTTHNDCQELVCERYPDVANALHWLLEYAPARMTGTGACVFATFEHHQQALDVQKLLPEGTNSAVAKGQNISPLHKLMNL